MRLFYSLCCSLILALSSPLFAADKAQPAVTSKKQAIEIAQKQESGKVLKITEQNNTFTVRILKPKGRVIDVIINKKDGQIKKD